LCGIKADVQLRANHLTISRILLLPIPCYLIFGETLAHKLIALAAFSLLALTDWWDGKLARKQGPTVLGGLLDPIADKMFLAFAFLPFVRLEGETGSGESLIPTWMAAVIFFREMAVTGMRSMAATHRVEFHTATLAKYKTAIQMGGGGFAFWNLVWQDNRVVLLAGQGAMVAVALAIAVVRAARGKPVGPKIWTQLALYSVATAASAVLPVRAMLDLIVYTITTLTVVSGAQYAYRVLGGLARKGWPVGPGEIVFRFLEAVAPTSVVSLLSLSEVPLWPVIAMLAAELGSGGLCDLIATEGARRSHGLAALRSLAILALGVAGWVVHVVRPELGLAPVAAIVSAAIASIYCAGLFVAHRRVYLR
jgi:CDP-diacylglycerol--glycerol-3-phosphate 3-phosphatidyltransferase